MDALCAEMASRGLGSEDIITLPGPSREREGGSLEPGAVLEEAPGRYRYAKEHARGGMGRILIVHDEFLARNVVLKELLPVAAISNSAQTAAAPAGGEDTKITERRSRFIHETRITGQLEHPSIVPVHELGQRVDGKPYYTMRLVRGRSLREAIQGCGGLSARLRLLPHFTDLCQAIAFAHSRGVIHRDIKPGNVMVGEFGETVVIDWGLAKYRPEPGDAHDASGPKEGAGPLEGEGAIALGTPAYMPPEQARGDLMAIDERSDVYSLGAVLYELLAGEAPYPDKSPSAR